MPGVSLYGMIVALYGIIVLYIALYGIMGQMWIAPLWHNRPTDNLSPASDEERLPTIICHLGGAVVGEGVDV